MVLEPAYYGRFLVSKTAKGRPIQTGLSSRTGHNDLRSAGFSGTPVAEGAEGRNTHRKQKQGARFGSG